MKTLNEHLDNLNGYLSRQLNLIDGHLGGQLYFRFQISDFWVKKNNSIKVAVRWVSNAKVADSLFHHTRMVSR